MRRTGDPFGSSAASLSRPGQDEKAAFLQRQREERAQRAERKLRESAATRIQAFYRRRASVRAWARESRAAWDADLGSVRPSGARVREAITAWLAFARAGHPEDRSRLARLCVVVIRSLGEVAALDANVLAPLVVDDERVADVAATSCGALLGRLLSAAARDLAAALDYAGPGGPASAPPLLLLLLALDPAEWALVKAGLVPHARAARVVSLWTDRLAAGPLYAGVGVLVTRVVEQQTRAGAAIPATMAAGVGAGSAASATTWMAELLVVRVAMSIALKPVELAAGRLETLACIAPSFLGALLSVPLLTRRMPPVVLAALASALSARALLAAVELPGVLDATLATARAAGAWRIEWLMANVLDLFAEQTSAASPPPAGYVALLGALVEAASPVVFAARGSGVRAQSQRDGSAARSRSHSRSGSDSSDHSGGREGSASMDWTDARGGARVGVPAAAAAAAFASAAPCADTTGDDASGVVLAGGSVGALAALGESVRRATSPAHVLALFADVGFGTAAAGSAAQPATRVSWDEPLEAHPTLTAGMGAARAAEASASAGTGSADLRLTRATALVLRLLRLVPSARLELLSMLAFDSPLAEGLWAQLDSGAALAEFARSASGGVDLAQVHASAAPMLLCECVLHLLLSLDDVELTSGRAVFFSTRARFLALARAVTSLAFRLVWSADETATSASVRVGSTRSTRELKRLRTVVTALARALHRRDSRLGLSATAADGGEHFWTVPQIAAGEFTARYFAELELAASRQLGGLDGIMAELASGSTGGDGRGDGEPSRRTRHRAVLKHLPFVVPRADRLALFSALVQLDKAHLGVDGLTTREIVVRRTNFLEDSIVGLNSLPGDVLKARLRVQFVNEHGLAEAGFGGGVMKEYLTELGAIAFNPDFGLFCETPTRMLFPNPASGLVLGRHLETFELLGRILGKAMYEAILVDVPLADFVLWQLLGEHSHLNDLASLDPELHRHLVWLKHYDGDVSEFALTFSLATSGSEVFGRAPGVVDLVPDGASRAVTNANRLQYVYLVAEYRLNGEIAAQMGAFRRGFASMIRPLWLEMFDQRELRTLMSGVDTPIDVADWERAASYGGGLTAGSPLVREFWAIVASMTASERAALLRFVTSCARPPVLGFGALSPPFCLQGTIHDDERLPSSATCFNILKLPFYSRPGLLRDKLAYAVAQNAGFELS